MPHDEQQSTIVQLAREMARSGHYRGWRTIAARLQGDGLPRVRDALGADEIRAELDRLCAEMKSPPARR